MKIYLPFIFIFLIAIPNCTLSQCDSICKAIYLDIEMRNTMNEFPHADDKSELYKIDSLNIVVDSLRQEIKLLQHDSNQWESYNDEYRVNCVECWSTEINQPLDTLLSAAEKCLTIDGLYPITMYKLWHLSNDTSPGFAPLGSIYYTHDYVIPYVEKHPELLNNQFNSQNIQDLQKINLLLKPYFKKNLEDFNEHDILFLYQIYQIIQIKNGFKYPR